MLGRTGNSLFQYALGRVLAKRHRVPLVMDGSWFNRAGWRNVSCLKRLPLKVTLRRRFSVTSRALNRWTGKHPWEWDEVPVLKEPVGVSRFDQAFLDAPSSCVLMGYFQSPKYFEGLETELREDLEMSDLEWSDATRLLADRMSCGNSVAVHVRRTDFVGRREFDVCGASYYRRAMNRLRAASEGLRFHLFSDDPAWCAGNLAGGDVEIAHIPGTGSDPLHDLYLMSLARHHVISNSSYSWWGAWLGKKAGQQVLCPDRWFGGDIEAPIEDKLCSGWQTVPTDG
ncbi:alpha-1,2-fucosyltransferase [Haloferula helveola]